MGKLIDGEFLSKEELDAILNQPDPLEGITEYKEVKDNTYGCQYFTEKNLFDLSNKINQFLFKPIKNNLNYRIVPIDTCLATEVLPNVVPIGESISVYNEVKYNMLLIYEKIFDTQ